MQDLTPDTPVVQHAENSIASPDKPIETTEN
jgi:hypothetical protein